MFLSVGTAPKSHEAAMFYRRDLPLIGRIYADTVKSRNLIGGIPTARKGLKGYFRGEFSHALPVYIETTQTMTKRKRYKKPDDQSTISAFFGASLAVTSARVAEEVQPEKHPNVRGAAMNGPSGEGGASALSDMEGETGTQTTR